MKTLNADQQAVAQAISENDQIIERLRRQNEQLARLLPKVRKSDRGFICHPLTGERAEYRNRGKAKR